jgi:hypothetical protein
VALVSASAVFGLASSASANLVGPPAGNTGITCTSVTFYYTLFPAGSTTNSTETVKVDNVTVVTKPFNFAGTIATDTVPIGVGSGPHTVTASASWTNSADGPGSGSFSAPVNHCVQCSDLPIESISFNFNAPWIGTDCLGFTLASG